MASQGLTSFHRRRPAWLGLTLVAGALWLALGLIGVVVLQLLR